MLGEPLFTDVAIQGDLRRMNQRKLGCRRTHMYTFHTSDIYLCNTSHAIMYEGGLNA